MNVVVIPDAGKLQQRLHALLHASKFELGA
jgi:hypothetical protein